MAETKMEDSREVEFNRLGDCEVCGSESAQYTCPRCELKTCSLNCVSIHKKELECSGERDKTGYIPLSKFTNLTLLSDYRFLEDISRAIDNSRRNPFKKYTRFKRPLPQHLFKLRRSAISRKTTLHFLPQHFTRHKTNTTHLNFKEGIIYWKIDFIFPQADNIKIVEDKCNENDRLSLILSKYIEIEKCPDLYKHHLRFYHSTGLAGVEVLLKAENVMNSDSFFLMDLSLPLKENLEGRIIVENPTMHVILKDHKYEYIVLDPDDTNSCPLNSIDQADNSFTPFHYFDAVTYTNKINSKTEKAASSIHSSVVELKKYFAADDSDESELECSSDKIGDVKSCAIQRTRTEINIPAYDVLIKQEH